MPAGFLSDAFQVFHIVNYHHGNLKGQRVIKLSDIQSTALFQFLNSINKSIPVYRCSLYLQTLVKTPFWANGVGF